MISEDEIKKLAQSIWEVERRPEGRDRDHYFRAKRMLEEKERVLQNMDKLARMMNREKAQSQYVKSTVSLT